MNIWSNLFSSKTVIKFSNAEIVKALTLTSSLCLLKTPHTVAGRTIYNLIGLYMKEHSFSYHFCFIIN